MFWILVICLVIYIAFCHADASTTCPSNITGGSSSKTKGGVNNPGNLRNFNIGWVGRVDSDNCEFDNFDTLANGVRAWGINLFQKVKKGQIYDTNSLVDVLTPAISENPEQARQNYKRYISGCKTWPQLFTKVFNFEDNLSWRQASTQLKNSALQAGLSEAIKYCYNGNTPSYFS